jgi:DNA-binding CsgD family transcriptional regulator
MTGAATTSGLVAMLPTFRKTGIRVMGEMPWGTHICVFYESKEDLVDTLVPYFKAGLDNNEYCVWAVSEPVNETEAAEALRQGIPGFDCHLERGNIEILPGREWYLEGDQFDLKKITGGWDEKLRHALARGYDGMRVSGNAFWVATDHWNEFCAYEQELDHAVANQPIIVLCTYALGAIGGADVLNVARAHQFTIARRNGEWEFLETAELKQAKQENKHLNDALGVLSMPFPGSDLLTPRERIVLAYVVKGASSKEAGQILGLSPRTIEFHRANVMQKLKAKNTADLVRIVLGEKNATAQDRPDL